MVAVVVVRLSDGAITDLSGASDLLFAADMARSLMLRVSTCRQTEEGRRGRVGSTAERTGQSGENGLGGSAPVGYTDGHWDDDWRPVGTLTVPLCVISQEQWARGV